MSAERYEQVKQDPRFAVLIQTRARWAWGLSAVILLMYFAFILVIAFAPNLLATTIASGSVITIGIPIGVAIIVLAFVLTGVYVHKANTDFDKLNKQIKDGLQ
ncbi:DUF485 domain-containing protein [Methylophaga sp. OBS3]|uniref:DUF485 domain-containing protein n=1 Tax=Methylophaga sp. OBS3 TaxID=2991934 RepID=UPI002259AD4A|nr:DUF485 domain-containing protein [Methylophaga sp. OBS3]MCX4190599.1 DUF485 domain-containing protein [Methylophaga sp. OBS3]